MGIVVDGLVIAVFLVVPSVAQAQAAPAAPIVPLDFEWLRGRGAESCPDAAQVVSEIEEKAGRKVFTPGAKHKIEVLITRAADVWTARIEERDATGLVTQNDPIPSESDDCKAIKDAAVLDVMLLLDHPEELGATAASDANCPTIKLVKVRPIKVVKAQPVHAKPVTATPPEVLKMTFTARASIRYGLLPGVARVAPDIGFFGSVGKKWWEFSGGLSWMPEATTEDDSAAFGLATVWLGGCLHPLRRTRFTLSGCGHALVGAMHGMPVSDKYDSIKAGESPWVGVAASPKLRIFPTSRLVLELGVDLTVPITTGRFNQVDVDSKHVYEQLPVTVSGFFGVGLSIP